MGRLVGQSKLDSSMAMGLNCLMKLKTPQAESWVEETYGGDSMLPERGRPILLHNKAA